MDDLENSCACGLDLGTTFSCIGVFKNGGVEIIPNTFGDKITPSIVTILDENRILKGEETIENLVKDYDSSIYAIKRFIGRDFKDPNVKREIEKENFPFRITENSKSNHLFVEVEKNGKKIEFNLEEISAFLVRKMVDNAEEYLKRKVKKLVITVPANFNDAQRQCTKQAIELAGLEVLRIINEPTAAALAYGLQEKNYDENCGNILVFDLGGGTFDVTILKIIKYDKDKNNEKFFEILSTSGDKFLGGEDFDNKLVEYVLNKFCKEYDESKEKIIKDKKAIKKLKISCENIKRVLSNRDETTLCINNFYDSKDINLTISRLIFEDICDDLFKKLDGPLNNALIDAKLTSEQIKEIVLVGGSSKIPNIKILLEKKFKNSKINDSINPDEAIAYGATLMAAKILLKNDNFTSKFNLMDITPFSLGTDIKNNSNDENIQKEGDLMSVIIKKGLKIPTNNTRTYATSYNNQSSISINIYEGENMFIKYNHLLKKATLEGLTKKPAGQVKIEVKFDIDVNGMLTVTGKEKGKEKNLKEIKINYNGTVLTDEEIKKKKKRFKNF